MVNTACERVNALMFSSWFPTESGESGPRSDSSRAAGNAGDSRRRWYPCEVLLISWEGFGECGRCGMFINYKTELLMKVRKMSNPDETMIWCDMWQTSYVTDVLKEDDMQINTSVSEAERPLSCAREREREKDAWQVPARSSRVNVLETLQAVLSCETLSWISIIQLVT